MPATRLLVIADPKLLPTLAAGLREAGRFDVVAVPIADLASAAVAIERAEAVALFYGTPDRPLAAALQSLAAPLRERGGRVIGVLQRDQVAQRDECFRAGASELLYMPMSKDQFVARLQSAVRLSYGADPGYAAAVSVATPTATVELPARVTTDGVHGEGELSFCAGETVRISWSGFQAWGLVVRGGPGVQVRFAGLWPEEEQQLRDWLKAAAAAAAASATSSTTTDPITTPAAGSSPVARAAPAAGPPPGFADRRPIRPITAGALRTPPRIPTLVSSLGEAPARVATPSSVQPVPAPAAPAQAAHTLSSPALPAPTALAGLFEDPAAPGADQAAAGAGPSWPHPAATATCKTAAVILLTDREGALPAELSSELTAAVRKVVGGLTSTERAALERLGFDSALGDALTARIALEVGRTEGAKLYSSTPPAVVDQTGLAALTQLAAAASSRLQKEADAAITKGEVEQLQLVTGASAALSRDLLAFKETADRLRGKSAAPRLGAGALDPHLALPGQAPRLTPSRQGAAEPAAVRAELRDFASLDETRPKRGIQRALIVASVLLVLAVGNLLFFSGPQIRELSVEEAGQGVKKIQISSGTALVTVNKQFIDHFSSEEPHLLEVLRSRGAVKAALVLESGGSAGTIDVTTGKVVGLLGRNPEVKKAPQTPAPPGR